MVGGDVYYFDFVSRYGVGHGTPVFAGAVGGYVILNVAAVGLGLNGSVVEAVLALFNLFVSVLLVSVEAFGELLDVWDTVGAGVVLARYRVLVGLVVAHCCWLFMNESS